MYEKKGRIWLIDASCNTQVKDEMSSGSSESSPRGLSNCNWFHALNPVAYNFMTRVFSFSGQVSTSNGVHDLSKLLKSGLLRGEVSLKRKVPMSEDDEFKIGPALKLHATWSAPRNLEPNHKLRNAVSDAF